MASPLGGLVVWRPPQGAQVATAADPQPPWQVQVALGVRAAQRALAVSQGGHLLADLAAQQAAHRQDPARSSWSSPSLLGVCA